MMPLRTLTLFLLLSLSSWLQAEVLVIVNANNPVDSLEPKQVVDLFMGKKRAFANGYPAQTLDLASGTPLRAQFYRALTGKSEAQIDAYWATLIFAGRMAPPKQFSDDQQVIEAVAANPSAIAYVSPQDLPDSVKVIMQLPTEQ
jgi:ABC-type phosphate transport system substrate-binding protein